MVASWACAAELDDEWWTAPGRVAIKAEPMRRTASPAIQYGDFKLTLPFVRFAAVARSLKAQITGCDEVTLLHDETALF
jgi:hypothetical protein